MASKKDYIAVFDSGVGGISVLRALLEQMPQERYLYFGDSANAPYGVRPAQQVMDLTLDAAQRLMQRGIKALVVACNTATAVAIETLRRTYPDTIIIGIEPALKVAADQYPGGRIGIMATPVTLQQEKLQHQLSLFPHLQVTGIPAPGLVEAIEAGNQTQVQSLTHALLSPYAGKLDVLVLGCTHYPFAQAQIRAVLGPEVALLDGALGTAKETRRRLAAADLLWDGPGQVEMENSSADRFLLELSMKLLEE